MLCVAVGSCNQTKVNATRAVFTSQFVGSDDDNTSGRRIPKNFTEIKVVSYEIDSAVSPTPASDEECIRGAVKRKKVSIYLYLILK